MLKVLKDYAVPIVWVLFILVIIWSISWGWSESDTQTDTQVTGWISNSYNASFTHSDTVAQVVYSWWRREEISDDTEIFPWETVVVQDWRLQLTWWDTTINLNRIAEFSIEWSGKYWLHSSDAWIESQSPISITMRYATINASESVIISLTQNEAGSTVYVLQWTVQVQNSAWVETQVTWWQRLSIPRLQASNRDFDIVSERVNIDTFFQNSDWFLENEGHLIEINQNNTESQDGESEPSESMPVWQSSNLIRFDWLRDEMSTDWQSINVSGTLISDNIWAISIQNTPVELNTSTRSFNLDNIPLPQAMNDLVVKIYDNDRNILQKEVYTVYTSSPSTNQSDTASTWSQDSQVSTPSSDTNQSSTHFDIDAREFNFTAPSTTGRYTTTSSEVTIRWETTADNVDRVEVNGFTLNSFNWRTWRYHAFERFDTIRDWTNQYRIDYYDSNGKIIFTDFFTIIKQAPWTATPTIPQNESTQETNNETGNTEPEETETSDESEVREEPESLFWE